MSFHYKFEEAIKDYRGARDTGLDKPLDPKYIYFFHCNHPYFDVEHFIQREGWIDFMWDVRPVDTCYDEITFKLNRTNLKIFLNTQIAQATLDELVQILGVHGFDLVAQIHEHNRYIFKYTRESSIDKN